MSYESLPARCLEKHELRALVDELARDAGAWREHVAFPEGPRRHYVSLHRDEYVDVWLLCWTPASDTGWHDHDISSGAVAVVSQSTRDSGTRCAPVNASTTASYSAAAAAEASRCACRWSACCRAIRWRSACFAARSIARMVRPTPRANCLDVTMGPRRDCPVPAAGYSGGLALRQRGDV